MKAYVLHAVNDLQYEDVAIPEIRHGWVLVKVKAAGICSSDIPRIFTKGTYHFPTIPGHEFSGIVEKVVDNDNYSLLGKHVGIFPLIPCRYCDPCKERHYEMCEHYDYIGSRRDGAFAEYVAVPAWNLLSIPTDMPFELAAMLEPLSVALHAVKRSHIKPGSTVAIVGTGMIGFGAAQWAQSMGASSVTVIGRSENKKQIADQIGVSYSTSNNGQYDVVIEAVGSQTSICTAINLAKPNGRVTFMGNPSGDILFPQDIYWRILRKQIHVTGTWNSSYESDAACDWTEARDAIIDKRVNVQPLITHTFDQRDLKDGLSLMREHKETYCKVMTLWNA